MPARRGAFGRALARVGLVLAVAAGLSAVVSAPAYAAPTDLTVSASGGVSLKVGGGAKQIDFTVRNEGLRADGVRLSVDVPLGGDGVSIVHGSDGCEVSGNSLNCNDLDFKPNESRSFFVKVQPPKSGGPAAGESRDGQGRAQVQYDEDVNNDNNSAGFKITLQGPDKPKAVAGITGVVKDEKSQDPVANAKVSVTDSAGKEHTTATGNDGAFKLASSQDQPIASGALKFTITKSGYATKQLTKTGDDGETVRVETALTPKAGASASAAASDTPAATDTGAPTTAAGGDDEGGGINWFAWLLYLLAAALVLGGIGAIIWLFRKRDEDDEDFEDDGAGPERPGPPGGGYGADPYGAPTTVMGGPQHTAVLGADQPTSMINRAGIDQPTSMIDRSGIEGADSLNASRPGLGAFVDQHTMAHPGPLVEDDGGDDVYPGGRENYAPGPGYGDPSSGYGRPEPDPYGADPGYRGDPGYGDPAGHQSGGYDDPGGYDQGDRSGGGRHSAEPAPPAGGYSGGDPGYGGPGYGGADPGYGGQGYGGASSGPGGDQGYGYDDRAGHDQRGGHRYDEQSPRRGGGRHSAGDDDRRLDWFED